MPKGEEFEALESVSQAFDSWLDGIVLDDDTLKDLDNYLGLPQVFLGEVTVKELKLVIELAQRHADLCD